MRGSLEILLDSDLYDGKGGRPTYTAGQAISGKVVYKPAARKDVDEVIILLRGRCHTVIRCPEIGGGFGKDSYAEDIELFRSKRTLFTGPFTMQPTTAEWQFGFILPNITNYKRNIGKDNWLYEVDSHQLPPSLSTSGDGHKALLAYSLTVIINPGSHLRAEEWNLPIDVILCCNETLPHPEVQPCLFTESKQHKLKASVAEKLTFRQRMNHVFSKDVIRTMNVSFNATAYMPSAASISQPLQISLSVKGLQSDANQHGVLVLVGASLGLLAKVHVRVQSRQADLDDKIWEELGSRRLLGAEAPLPDHGGVLELSSTTTLADLVLESERHRITGSFKTYTINRSYYLKLTVAIRDSAIDHVFNIESRIPFLVLPVEHPSVNSHAVKSFLPRYSEVGQALPVYVENASGI